MGKELFSRRFQLFICTVYHGLGSFSSSITMTTDFRFNWSTATFILRICILILKKIIKKLDTPAK